MRDRIPLQEAEKRAAELAAALGPYSRRIEVVGSIRRRRPLVKDIELLVEPEFQTDLLGSESPLLEPLRRKLKEMGEVLKGGDRYIQLRLEDGLKVDVFLCHPPASWGSLLAIRTGPARLSEWCVTKLRERDMKHESGTIWVRNRVGWQDPGDGGGYGATWHPVEITDERTFFRACGVEYLPPELRDTDRYYQARHAGAADTPRTPVH